MELKCYLRGLGLGIVMTAIIMGFMSSKGNAMTNEEIIARAKQLGMTENTVLSEIDSDKDKDTDTDGSDGADTDNPDLGEDDSDSQDVSEPDNVEDDYSEIDAGIGIDAGFNDSAAVNSPIDSSTDAEAGDSDEASSENQNLSSESMVITIGNGDGSYSVSEKLADIGAVSSASDFDNFLCQNGFDKKIRSGTYTIPVNASDEQMARIITGEE